jgi:naphthalene 1,2-dioxygenase system ferredoxin subunit
MSSDDWQAAALASQISPGQMYGSDIAGQRIAIYNVDGTFFATSNICTHAFSYLTDGWFEGKIIECPLHAGQFDVTTGQGLGPPITCDVRTFKVRVVCNRIEVNVVESAIPSGSSQEG